MNKIFCSIVIAILMGAQVSHAEKPKSSKMPMMEMTAEQRENMAKMHEGMASCLRSTKSMKDCRADMKSSCENMGKDACPMMGKGKRGMMMYEE